MIVSTVVHIFNQSQMNIDNGICAVILGPTKELAEEIRPSARVIYEKANVKYTVFTENRIEARTVNPTADHLYKIL